MTFNRLRMSRWLLLFIYPKIMSPIEHVFRGFLLRNLFTSNPHCLASFPTIYGVFDIH